MCNLSVQINDSTSNLDETLNMYMYCICKGHFGVLFIIVITTLFLFVGVPIHCYSLWLFLHGNVKCNLVFPLNITIVELVFCMQSFIDLIVISDLSMASFQLAIFLNGICWTVRPLVQICMCFEHYLAVIHPVTFLTYNGIQYRIALATAAWLIGLGNGMRIIFMKTDLFPDRIFFFFFCTAVITASYCCISILHVLKRPGPGDHNNVEMREKDRHNKTDRSRAAENQQKRKAFRIISHILMSILVCYLPVTVAYFVLEAKITKETYICKVFPLSMSITVATVILSPLIKMYGEGHLKRIMCLSKLRG